MTWAVVTWAVWVVCREAATVGARAAVVTTATVIRVTAAVMGAAAMAAAAMAAAAMVAAAMATSRRRSTRTGHDHRTHYLYCPRSTRSTRSTMPRCSCYSWHRLTVRAARLHCSRWSGAMKCMAAAAMAAAATEVAAMAVLGAATAMAEAATAMAEEAVSQRMSSSKKRSSSTSSSTRSSTSTSTTSKTTSSNLKNSCSCTIATAVQCHPCVRHHRWWTTSRRLWCHSRRCHCCWNGRWSYRSRVAARPVERREALAGRPQSWRKGSDAGPLHRQLTERA